MRWLVITSTKLNLKNVITQPKVVKKCSHVMLLYLSFSIIGEWVHLLINVPISFWLIMNKVSLLLILGKLYINYRKRLNLTLTLEGRDKAFAVCCKNLYEHRCKLFIEYSSSSSIGTLISSPDTSISNFMQTFKCSFH